MHLLSKLLKQIIYKPSYKHIDEAEKSSEELATADGNFVEDIPGELEDIKNYLRDYFHNSSDVVFNEFEPYLGVKVLIVYIDGLINVDVVNRDIINSFISADQENNVKSIAKNPEKVRDIVSVADIQPKYNYWQVTNEILSGSSAIFVNGMKSALVINSKGYEKRAVTEPASQSVVRGPKESFVENLLTNTSLIRRKIKNNNLVIESLELGKQTKTSIAIAHIHGIAKIETVQKVKDRISKINIDSILGSGYLEQYIEDNKFSLFPTIWNTEKPDVIASNLLEGRVAIFCDGTPHVLTVPTMFVEFFQSSEDYYVRPYFATITRMIRFSCFFISTLLPAFYIALQTFHQEMVPTILLVKMSGAMRGVPFPTLLETLLMVFFFEVLRESGIRLPRVIGPAISIVGALIMGESAVNAGLVSSTIVIVIALTAICSFAIPDLGETIVILRILFALLAGFLGLFGITCGIFAVIIHLVSLRSFGADYTFPMAPFNISGMKDMVIRFPLHMMKSRPAPTAGANKVRRNRKKE